MRFRSSFATILLTPVLALSPGVLPASAHASAAADDYGPWRNADGDGKIQYRWYTYGESPVVPKCSYQLRNADSSDTSRYDSSIDYTSVRGGNVTTSGPFLDKTYHENSGNIIGCTAITNIFMRRH